MLTPWVLNEKKPLAVLKKDQLSAGGMLQVRKVAKHVYEKLFVQDTDKELDEDYLTEVSDVFRMFQYHFFSLVHVYVYLLFQLNTIHFLYKGCTFSLHF